MPKVLMIPGHLKLSDKTTICEFFHETELPRTTYQSGSSIFMRKDGRRFVGQNKMGKQLSDILKSILWLYRPRTAIIGPITLEIFYVRPYLKTASKLQKQQDPLVNDKRPDCDNIAKGILDAMQACEFFKDDAQIYSLKINKLYSNTHGLGIIIKK